MRVKKWGQALAVAGLVASAVVLSACSSGGETKEQGGSETKATTAASAKAQTVSITLKDNVFEPKDITVEEGTVTFEVKNTGTAIHNMHITSTPSEGKDFSSKPIVEAGSSDKFTATFTKKGVVKFQCDFHLPDMVGTITVK